MTLLTPNRRKVAVSFTGGKDSMLALHLLHPKTSHTVPTLLPSPSGPEYEIALLVTFTPPLSKATPFLSHPRPLILAQAESLGIPHQFLEIDDPHFECYQEQMKLLNEKEGITGLVTGDVEDVADGYMERVCDGTGVSLIRPLWRKERIVLLEAVWVMGLRPLISCVNVGSFGSWSETDRAASWVGQILDSRFFEVELRDAKVQCDADECGEGGEYHTMVVDGPLFLNPIVTDWQRGTSKDAKYIYMDILNIHT
ncbi:hypothetical protein HK097_008496 [Rhizophlyctis rosea]|uniref:Diphthine--ammonia ligase n=1 Tax=Rhizophlyctis rosea TaxID=64517 RepID=A0AAD5X9A4_9FUNG|nr:hypothetical protein HK097_008496 [Rhizophlyctis rosea]